MSENSRNASSSGSDNDFDYFITTELPLQQIHDMLTLQKKSSSEIESTLEKVKESRDRINKYVRRFIRKVENYYGHLDIPDLMTKGLKHATKHKFSEAEKQVFINHVMKGDVYGDFSFLGRNKITEMSKFLGYSEQRGTMLRIDPADYAKLNELKGMYDAHVTLHANVKNNMFNYRDCAPEALTGAYDRTKHDVTVSIHPVIAMLFLPKVEYIEKRMLYTNIARMVLSRGQAYLKNANFHLQTGVVPGELDAEFELAHDIAYDPNTLSQFKDATPINNIIIRFRCQIELYKTVLNLRQGRYYSTGYGHDDGITGFLNIINKQDWTFFDSPDLYHVQDEGTILRKLLAVFSIRPTLTLLTSYGQRYGLGFANVTNMAKSKVMNMPIINLKLPLDLTGGSGAQDFNLARSLQQSDTFIEHRAIVPKNKSVIFSREVCFFYANRKYQAVNFTALDATLNLNCMALPSPIMNTTKTNTTKIVFNDEINIGRDRFEVRSVCMLQRPPLNGLDIPTGVSAAIRHKDQATGQVSYFHYNPSGASIQFYDSALPAGNTQFRANDPITWIPEYDLNPNRLGFKSEAEVRGTIFLYTKM